MSDLAIQWSTGSLALATLNASTALVEPTKVDASREQGFRVTKIETAVAWTGKTDGEGPILWGLAFGQTAAEIEEAIEDDPQGMQNEAGRTLQEHQNRPVWPIGIVSPSGVAGVLDEGKVIVLRPNWSAPEGGTMDFFAYNFGSGSLTTGTVMRYVYKLFGVWLRD